MTDGVAIPLERFILEKLAETEQRFDLQFAAVRAEFKLKLDAAEAAKVLQAKEYERRLTDLNHAHALAAEAQHTFASKEMLERDGSTLSGRLVALELAYAQQRGGERIVWALYGFLSAAAIAFAVLVVGKGWPV